MAKKSNTPRYKIIVDGVVLIQAGAFDAIFALCERLYPQGFTIVPVL